MRDRDPRLRPLPEGRARSSASTPADAANESWVEAADRPSIFARELRARVGVRRALGWLLIASATLLVDWLSGPMRWLRERRHHDGSPRR